MSVAVACNLSEGVILGVDSAVSIGTSKGGVSKVYENAEKLYQLGDRPIGVAFFGLSVIGSRNLGSYLREFEAKDPNGAVSGPSPLKTVVEELRKFFFDKYQQIIIPELEKKHDKKFEEIPANKVPAFGLVIGGFSSNEYLSEVWEILIPRNSKANNATQKRGRGDFGTNWFGMYEPIRRYIKGYDNKMVQHLQNLIEKLRGEKLTSSEQASIKNILRKFEYPIPYAAMPMEEGIEHTRFLVELVINHHRFAMGAPVVGGKANIGKVTYKAEKFQILSG